MKDTMGKITSNQLREWTVAIFDVGLDEIIVRTPCCSQEYKRGAYYWDIGVKIMCEACATPYDVVFQGYLGHGGRAGWARE